MIDKNPKIFISYAWGNEEIKERVRDLAERLIYDGVEVILDIWCLREGQDKYLFMEKSVNDETIDRVLIICDKVYKIKADNRKGGVGDETAIISSEVYNNSQQSKFIPVVFERDENGNDYIPTYLKSRMFIDFTSDNEEQYEQLIRLLYEKPLYKKPALGKMPEWLSDDNKEEKNLTESLRKLKKANEKGMVELAKNIERQFIGRVVGSLNAKMNEDAFSSCDVIDKVDKLKMIRDNVFEFVEELAMNDELSADFIVSLLEEVYNKVPTIENMSYTQSDFECYDFFRWELFIGVTAILLHFELYGVLRMILTNTYFLRMNCFQGAEEKPCGYISFNNYMESIEERCSSHFDKNYYSKKAYLLCGREKYPILTKQAMSRADLILYHMSKAIDVISTRWSNIWFPHMYVYAKDLNLWKRLLSKKYCDKIMPLFGVSNIEELRKMISKVTHDNTIKYMNAWEAAPSILDYIELDKIGILP